MKSAERWEEYFEQHLLRTHCVLGVGPVGPSHLGLSPALGSGPTTTSMFLLKTEAQKC